MKPTYDELAQALTDLVDGIGEDVDEDGGCQPYVSPFALQDAKEMLERIKNG